MLLDLLQPVGFVECDRRSLRRADLAEEIVDLAAQLLGRIAQHLRAVLTFGAASAR
jgi:hypothetical protein